MFSNSVSKSPRAGFSILEVLVAIGLLLVALVGPMTFFARSSQSAEVANDRAVATFLAQEGAELVQKLRDDRMLEYFLESNQDGWQEFLDDVAVCFNGSPCGLSLSGSNQVHVRNCSTEADCVLRYDETVNRARFNHQTGTETDFSRLIELQPVGNREVEIISRVEWRSTSLRDTQSVEVSSYVFNIFIAN